MENTGYVLGEKVREALAQGYNFSWGKLRPVDYLEITVRGAASVFSTVDDMCRYVSALLGGGANQHGRVLKPETLSLMMEPHYHLDERLPAMGLAFVLDDFGGYAVAGHDGGWPGFLSSMLVCPAQDFDVVAPQSTGALARLQRPRLHPGRAVRAWVHGGPRTDAQVGRGRGRDPSSVGICGR